MLYGDVSVPITSVCVLPIPDFERLDGTDTSSKVTPKKSAASAYGSGSGASSSTRPKSATKPSSGRKATSGYSVKQIVK